MHKNDTILVLIKKALSRYKLFTRVLLSSALRAMVIKSYLFWFFNQCPEGTL